MDMQYNDPLCPNRETQTQKAREQLAPLHVNSMLEYDDSDEGARGRRRRGGG